jgi:transposase
VHVAAVAGQVGRVLGTWAFPADAAGYAGALAWMGAHGALAKVGVEGTGSYGCGLARHLAAAGVRVVEVIRPNRQARRQRGKSDAADAVAAALAALNGEASGVPKSHDGAAESIRMLKVARAGAVKARTQAASQLRDLIVTAPQALRQQLAGLPAARQVKTAARFRPGDLARPADGARAAMASVARRHQELTAEIARLDAALGELVTHAAPAEFLAKQGVATQVAATLLATTGDNPGRVRKEASFAALCGASPAGASSGKQIRHRLNRGGDRQANSALWTIAMTRLAHDPAPRPTWPGAPPRARPKRRSSAASSAISPARSTRPCASPNSQAGHQRHNPNKNFRSGLDIGVPYVKQWQPGGRGAGRDRTRCRLASSAR